MSENKLLAEAALAKRFANPINAAVHGRPRNPEFPRNLRRTTFCQQSRYGAVRWRKFLKEPLHIDATLNLHADLEGLSDDVVGRHLALLRRRAPADRRNRGRHNCFHEGAEGGSFSIELGKGTPNAEQYFLSYIIAVERGISKQVQDARRKNIRGTGCQGMCCLKQALHASRRPTISHGGGSQPRAAVRASP
jgi:hypothetical protein